MRDAVTDAARVPVPSEREVDLGIAEYTFEPLAPPPPEPEVSAGDRLKAVAADLSPRSISEGTSMAPLVLLALSTLLLAWDRAAVGVLLPDIQRDFNVQLGFIIVLATTVELVNTLLGPLMGYLADRLKRVRMLAIGTLMTTVSYVATAFAPTVPLLTVARTGAGVGRALVEPVAYPLLTDWYSHRVRARVLSLVYLGGAVGALIGPTAAGALGSWFGWRAALGSIGMLAVVAAVGMLYLKEPRRGELDRIAMGASVDVAEREQEAVGWAESWRAARSITSLRRIWYATPFVTVGGQVLGTLLLLHFADTFGVTTFQRGLIGSVFAIFGVIGLAVSGPVADRLLAYRPGRVFTLLGGILILNSLLITLMLVSPVLWMAIVFAAPIGLGISMAVPALFTLVSMVVPSRIRGFGLQTIAPWQVIGLLLVLVLTAVSDVQSALWLAIPAQIIGAVLIGSAGSGVDNDIRSARAASMADEDAAAARRAGGNKMIICRDVDVTYDGTQVLFNVDLDIDEGEIVALLGTNGAGKSTLLRAISGIQEASAGAIFLDGRDVTHRPAHENAADGVVFMPGGQAVFPTLTVGDNLRAAAWLDRARPDAAVERTEYVLDLFPVLRERLDEKAGNLSGGEQQMVALAQAFLMRPRLLMIDELSLGLAPQVVAQLLDVVRQVNAAGTTVVLVEQSVNIALTVAHRAVFLDKGEIRFDGPTSDLLSRSDLVRSVFLGGVGGGAGGLALASGSTGLKKPVAEQERREVLAARDVAVSFGGKHALTGASVHVIGGEIVGIIGPNGAGKTTLFDVVSGYVRPDTGVVAIAGADAEGMSPDARARAGLGRSFQNARMFPSLTVRENIAVALEQRIASKSVVTAAAWLPAVRRSERRVRRRVDYLIDVLALDAYADKFAVELSTGTRRMVDVACVMASEPNVLLLDEPSSGLAQAEVEVLGPVIRRLARESGCGILVIEHDLPLITALADRLVAMELGAVIAEGAPDDVIADPEVVRAYLGASQATLERSGSNLSAALAAAGITSGEDR